MQIEYAMDISFRSKEVLEPLYDNIIQTAMHTVKTDNIANFLGRKFSLLFGGKAGIKYNKRILGTRIKHQMGDAAVKMHDKAGVILRIECTSNDVSQFKEFREAVKKDGTVTQKAARIKKSIYSLYGLVKIFKGIMGRYLEYISEFDGPSEGEKNLGKVTKDVRKVDRNYKGFNFFNDVDRTILETITRGEFTTKGMQNKNLRELSMLSAGRI